MLGNAETCDVSAALENSPQAPLTQPSSNPKPSSERTVLPQHSTPVLLNTPLNHSPVQSSSTRAERSLLANKEEKLRNKSAADADQCVAEYFKAKKARLETIANKAATGSQNIDRKEGLKMFLLRFVPELEELSDSQIKLFKRRIFSVIDEISTASQPQRSSFVILLSPQSGFSHSSAISHTSVISTSTSLLSQVNQFYTDFTQAFNSGGYDVQQL